MPLQSLAIFILKINDFVIWKNMGAEVEETITNLYSADEVFMVTRNVKI